MSKPHYRVSRETRSKWVFLNTEEYKLNQMVFGAGGQKGERRSERRKGGAKESRPSPSELSQLANRWVG